MTFNSFKTQREIYQALLDGEKIVYMNGRIVYMREDGQLSESCVFNFPEHWSIKCEAYEHEADEVDHVCINCRVKLKQIWVEA